MSEPAPWDVIALGETMLSLVAAGDLATASQLFVTHGGAESNTCVGLARLGLRPAWVSRVGTDPPGDRIVSALAGSDVDVGWVSRDEGRPTGVMLRDTVGTVRYYRTGSAASALTLADLDGVPFTTARAVFVTGITALIGETPRETALELLAQAGGLRVVDPNLRLGLWGSDRAVELIEPMIRCGDLVLGGITELAAFVGDGEPAEVARRCGALGPREVVVKMGSAGAGVLDEAGRWHTHAPAPAAAVDPVGAGDAFNAGYLSARLDGEPPERALVRGTMCGAAVAACLGDTEGFPTPAARAARF